VRLSGLEKHGGGETPVATWRDGRRVDPALADSSVQRLLADAKQPRSFTRADQIQAPAWIFEPAGVAARVLVREAAMATRGDDGRPEQSPCHGTKNRRSADAKAGC
jgi:hypothetical protein